MEAALREKYRRMRVGKELNHTRRFFIESVNID